MTTQKLADLVTVSAKYEFTRSEREQQAQLLAQSVKDQAIKESEKKSVMAQYKDEIEKIEKEIKIYSNHVNDGYTFKEFPCELHLDFDRKKRLYFDKQNHEIIKEEDFHNSDYQRLIDFQAEEKKLQDEIAENNLFAPDLDEEENEQLPI